MSRAIAEALRARRTLFGSWTSLGHPSITEAFAAARVDFVGIDFEHSTITQEQAQRLIAAAQAGGAAALPRVASHNGEQIRCVLDSGADGLIVPNVTTPQQVRQLVAWSKYPPVGQRGYGVARAHGYGLDFARYTSEWNRRCALIIQIESLQGVEAGEELLADPHVNGAMIGPYDISGSLDVPGQLHHPRVTAACRRLIETCRRQGKSCGTQLVEPTPRNVHAALRMGFTFVVLSSDVFILWKWAERMRTITGAASLRAPAGAAGDRSSKKISTIVEQPRI